MSEPGLTNPWEPWQRLLDSIGPDYRRRFHEARERAMRDNPAVLEELREAYFAEHRR